jgi:hypothetical protein
MATQTPSISDGSLYTSPSSRSSNSSWSSRRPTMDRAKTATFASARSSSSLTLSRYQSRHMPPSYNKNTIMPLLDLDIDLTMTEGSSSSLDCVPSTSSDQSSTHKPIVVCIPSDEENDDRNSRGSSQTPKIVDLSPSFSSSRNSSSLSKRMLNQAVCRDANFVMWMDVRYCISHTCSACREPKYPTFIPIESSSSSTRTYFPLSRRPLAGTRWWERDDDDDPDLLAQLMRPMLEYINANSCDMMSPLALQTAAFLKQESTQCQQPQQQQRNEPMLHQSHTLIPPSSFSSQPPRCPRRLPDVPAAEHHAQRNSSKKQRRQKKDKHMVVEDRRPPKNDPPPSSSVAWDESMLYVPFDEL